MMTDAATHLTADELDALLTGTPTGRVTSHLATCPPCQDMVALDRAVVAALGTLPPFDPAPGFEGRVMARVTVRSPLIEGRLVLPRSPRETAARRRVAIGGLVLGGVLAAGFAWAAANPDAAAGLTTPALRDLGETLWVSVQGLSANAMEQPWFGAVRDALATPARALPAVAGVIALYSAALVGFRRLLAEPATDAGW